MANATIRVQFGNPDGSGSDGHLSAEVDTRPDGLNGGRSSFSPGETAYILVYKSDNVSITDTICSAGSLSAQGSAVVTVTEELMFEDADTATLGKPARSAIAQSVWYGRSLGGLTLQSDKVTVRHRARVWRWLRSPTTRWRWSMPCHRPPHSTARRIFPSWP